ncbi:MAG: ral secretion pathway protein GspD [Proteobacteria bacterium]|nr:ral secretion pathway protein GspD [Pseudomonadota bacterium]
MWSAVLLLAGCANEMTRRDGMSLIMDGHYEDGLAKLAQLAAEDPKNTQARQEYLRQREQAVNRVLNAATSELANERFEAAEGLYRRALNIESANQAARNGLTEVATARRHAKWLSDAQTMLKKGDLTGAKAAVNLVLVERPGDVKANQLRYQLEEQNLKESLAGPRLNIKGRRPVTLQFRDANLKMVLEAISRTTGVNIMIDKDVRNDIKVSIFVKDTAVEETLDLILLQNQLEKRILGENSVLIYPLTPAKSKEYLELKVRRFALVNADPKQVQTMIKTILKSKDVYVDERSNAVVVRDTAPVIRLAEKLVSSMDQPDSEVMLEVELLDVDRSRSLALGIDWPTAASATLSWPLSGAAATLQAFKNMTSADVGVSVSNATVSAKAQGGNTDTRTLATPRIRVRNKEKAKIMIGDRTPVISSAAVPGTGTVGGGSGLAAVFNTSIQYLETGIKLEVEPTIYLDGNVAIKLNLEVSKLGDRVDGPSGSIAFKTTTNNASTVLRLKDGETQVMGGLIQASDSMSQNNKVPGLGDIPFLGRLFGIQNDQWGNRELVLAITPHIIRNNQISEADLLELWSGTESSVKFTAPDLKIAASSGVVNQGTVAAGNRLPPPAAPRAAPSMAAAPGLTVNVNGPAQAKVGDKINVALNALGGAPISTLGLTVAYDSDALKALTVSEGDLLRRAGVKGNFDWKIDEASGTISAELTTENGASAAAGGNIAALQFEVIGGQGPVLISASGITATDVGGGSLAIPNPPALTIAIQP